MLSKTHVFIRPASVSIWGCADMPNFDVWYPLGISATIYSILTLRLWIKKLSRRLREFLGMRVDEEEKASDVQALLERRKRIRDTVRAIVEGKETRSFSSSLSLNPLMESDAITDMTSGDGLADLGRRDYHPRDAPDQTSPRRASPVCGGTNVTDALSCVTRGATFEKTAGIPDRVSLDRQKYETFVAENQELVQRYQKLLETLESLARLNKDLEEKLRIVEQKLDSLEQRTGLEIQRSDEVLRKARAEITRLLEETERRLSQ